MVPTQQHPQPGADSTRLGTWRIYILDPHALRWKPIGTAVNRAMAEHQLAALRRMLRGHRLTIAWEETHA